MKTGKILFLIFLLVIFNRQMEIFSDPGTSVDDRDKTISALVVWT